MNEKLDKEQRENIFLAMVFDRRALIKWIFHYEFEHELYNQPGEDRERRLKLIMDRVMNLWPEVDFNTPTTKTIKSPLPTDEKGRLIAHLDHEMLVSMVMGTQPHFDIMNSLLIERAGVFDGEKWHWDQGTLYSYDKPTLIWVYQICRNSWPTLNSK